MQISLTPEQEAWLKTRVAVGDVASIEEAARRVIDERIAEERQRKKDRREVLRATDLSDEEIAAIAAVRMDPRHAHLDDELTNS